MIANKNDLDFQSNLRAMLSWFVSPKSRGLELADGRHCAHMIAQNIALGYAAFPAPHLSAPAVSVGIPALVPAAYQGADADFLRPVIDAAQWARTHLREYVDHCLVHGSLATLDYARGWSDFDTYLVINRETATDPARLMALRDLLLDAYPLLLRIDPLQHHGFLLCTALDLERYPSHFMPIPVLQQAKSLLGDTRVRVRVMPESIGNPARFIAHEAFFRRTWHSGILKHHGFRGEYLLDNYHNRDNGMYQMKNFLEFVMLLPAYYLEAVGAPCYKRESFEPVRQLVPVTEWDIVDCATRIRARWPDEEIHPYPSNRIPAWLEDELGPDYFHRMYRLVRRLCARFNDVGASV